jgi:hypothetical protein
MSQNTVTSAQLIDFLERHHTLHKKIEITYVVTGYETTLTYDERPISLTYHGETLRAALIKMVEAGDKLERTPEELAKAELGQEPQ